jgi:magnesium transporter
MYRILHRTKSRQIVESTDIESIHAMIAEKDSLTWIDIFQPVKADQPAGGRDDLQHLLAEHFAFHPLAVEDALIESSTPKLDDWDQYLYIVLHAVSWDKALKDVDTAEMDVFLGANYLITFHDEPIPAIDRIWKNSMRDERHTRRGADFLLYEVCDGRRDRPNRRPGVSTHFGGDAAANL